MIVGKGFHVERPSPGPLRKAGHGPKSKSEFDDGNQGGLAFWQRESHGEEPVADERQ